MVENVEARTFCSQCIQRSFRSSLEEARLRGALLRVGGYRFNHALLQRHFAAHEEPGCPRVPILAETESPPHRVPAKAS